MINTWSCLEQKKYTFLGKSLSICTFLTVISQLPQIVNIGISSLISKIVWFIFLFLSMLAMRGQIKINIRKNIFAIVMMFVYILFATVVSVISNKQYYATSLFNSVLLSLFIFFIGSFVSQQITQYDYQRCAMAYLVASIILALDLYFTIYRGVDVSTVLYAYASKNSAGVIIFTGFLVAFVYGWRIHSKFLVILNVVTILFLIYLVLIMKTRAMIVCIPVVVGIAAMRAPFKRRIKIPMIIMCMVLIILLQNAKVYDMLINDILLGGRAGDLNSVSSGRLDQWLTLADNMRGNMFIGDGVTEQESLILTALIQCGLPMGIMIISYAAWPLVYAVHKVKKNHSYEVFLLLLVSIVYFIDAVFEQLAPFGPGARCFYLWLIFGILLAKDDCRERKEDRNGK